ncbi:MAG: vanadium-dependent haloperoxidase [Candidatus Limnocylindrales bacterium]
MTLSRERAKARRWLAACSVLVLVMVTALIPATSASAAAPGRMVLDWNQYAIQAISNPGSATPPGLGQPPPLAPIHLAMVQGAIYDAVNAIDRQAHEPYLRGLPHARASASRAAAVATAAHHVLVGLDTVPAMPANVRASLDSLYSDSLATIVDNRAKWDGIAVGAATAQAMLDARRGDGRFGSATFVTSTDIGKWQLVPPASNNVFAWIKDVRPFAVNGASQFRSAGPPALTSAQYAAEFNEVRAKGAKTGSTRTAAETNLAHFVSVSPVPMMNTALRTIAEERGLSVSEQARLFAMTSISAADALITCWDDKFARNFWRPYTAIRNATADGNAATIQDDNWETFLPTPGYPDHPSGYNCFTGGLMYAAKAYFGTDDVSFSLTSPGTNPPTTTTTRNYTRFTDVTLDAIEGRILMGLHFRTPDVQGAGIGRNVAEWVASHYLRPIH